MPRYSFPVTKLYLYGAATISDFAANNGRAKLSPHAFKGGAAVSSTEKFFEKSIVLDDLHAR